MMQTLPPIIALTGLAETGKSEVARILRERFGYVGNHINEPMVEMAAPLLRRMGVPEDEIQDRLTGSRKNEPIRRFPWLTGRIILQKIGKDLKEALGHPVNAVGGQPDETFFLALWEFNHEGADRLINESARYPVEVSWTRSRNGLVIRMHVAGKKPVNDHQCEQGDLPYDALLVNHMDGFGKLERRLGDMLAAWSDGKLEQWNLLEHFEADICDTMLAQKEQVGSVCRRIGAEPDLDEMIDDKIADIKGHYGARLANMAPSDAGADAAIAEAEAWVTDNVSNSSNERRVAAVFVHGGSLDLINA